MTMVRSSPAVSDEDQAAAAASVIRCADLAAGYPGRRVLEHVAFGLGPGELVAIVGPNGSGKSTLLKVLAGLLPVWAGSVAVLGQPPGRQPLRVAYLPQAESVDWSFPVSVRDVVLMGRYRRAGWLRRLGPADAHAAESALELVGLRDLADRQIGELSGGQQRRAFLARSLAQDPALYLLDEPVTGVDPTTEDELMGILAAECGRGKTVLASTHDLGGVAEHFSRVISLNGTIVADGPAALVRDAAVLRATYGGHLIEVERGNIVLLDDPHHRDAGHAG
jgi:ABC-type Mn2+/Zn2+ transport system ATPase subunit